MTLQNRVTPFGDIVATNHRGAMFGNRGGRIHDPDTKTLTRRRWASKRWICCVLSFKGRQRSIWGKSYTELFFHDEATAMAAGHRPCYECRRTDAIRFAHAVQRAFDLTERPGADQLDDRLHPERLSSLEERSTVTSGMRLPDGTVVAMGPQAILLHGNRGYPWGDDGWQPQPLERGHLTGARLLTPATMFAALHAGYRPQIRLGAESPTPA